MVANQSLQRDDILVLCCMRETQKKGDKAVAKAISSFTSLGLDVLLPVTESAAYDLVVDTPSGLKRIQVRFSSCRDVGLRRIHSNASGYVVKKPKSGTFDFLYVLFEKDGITEEHLFEGDFCNRSYVRVTSRSIFGALAERLLRRS